MDDAASNISYEEPRQTYPLDFSEAVRLLKNISKPEKAATWVSYYFLVGVIVPKR